MSQVRSLARLLEGYQGDIGITGLTLDSRAVQPGDLFVALQGEAADGHAYVSEAVAAGAVAVVSERPVETHVPNIVMIDLRHRVSAIAAEFFGHPSAQLRVVGVTGTNGKSTVTDLLRQCYQKMGRTAVAMGTLGFMGIWI